MAALLTPPAIPDGARYECLTRPRRLGLIAPESSHLPGNLDCHPLMREHFADLLKEQFPQSWQEGNPRLYEHYKNVARELPDTIEEMAPLCRLHPWLPGRPPAGGAERGILATDQERKQSLQPKETRRLRF